MRAYKPKDDVQKKSYYSDRFFVTPQLARQSVYNDSTFSNDYLSLSNVVEVNEVYLELDHLVVYVNPEDNFAAIKHAKEIMAYDFLMELSAIDYLADKMMDLIGIKVSKKYQELALGDPEKSDGTVGNMVKLFSTNIESFTKLQIGLKKTILHIKNEE